MWFGFRRCFKYHGIPNHIRVIILEHWPTIEETHLGQVVLSCAWGEVYFLQEVNIFSRSIQWWKGLKTNHYKDPTVDWWFTNQLNHLLYMWTRMKHEISSRNQLGTLMPYFWSIKRYYSRQPVTVPGWAVPTYKVLFSNSKHPPISSPH